MPTESAIPTMNRYDSDEEGVMRESKDGMYCLYSNIETRDQQIIGLLNQLEHALWCNSRHSVMGGGISLDVNVRPNAQPHKLPCNCPHAEIMALLGRR